MERDLSELEEQVSEEFSGIIDVGADLEDLESQLQNIHEQERRAHHFNTGPGIWINRLMPLPVIAAGIFYQISPTTWTFEVASLNIPFMLVSILLGQVLWQVLLAQRANGFMLTRTDFALQAIIARRKGQPFRSLEGYDEVEHALRSEHMQSISHRVIGMLAIICYLITLIGALNGAHPAAWAAMLEVDLSDPWPFLFAMSVAIGTGLSVIVWLAAVMDPTSAFDASEPTGLLDVYVPSGHPSFLTTPFNDIVSYVLEPGIASRWTEHNRQIGSLALESASEEEALERLLVLMHLDREGVITKEELRSELEELYPNEVVNRTLEGGIFDRATIHDLLDRAAILNPSFFRLVERLEYRLLNEMAQVNNAPVIFDCEIDRKVVGQSLNLMLLVADTAVTRSTYEIEIRAPGLEPEIQRYNVSFNDDETVTLPTEDVSIIDEGDDDLIRIMGQVLNCGNVIWLTLRPSRMGRFHTQVMLKDSSGDLIAGRTMVSDVNRDLRQFMAQHSKKAGMASGAFVPLMKALPSMRRLFGLP